MQESSEVLGYSIGKMAGRVVGRVTKSIGAVLVIIVGAVMIVFVVTASFTLVTRFDGWLLALVAGAAIAAYLFVALGVSVIREARMKGRDSEGVHEPTERNGS